MIELDALQFKITESKVLLSSTERSMVPRGTIFLKIYRQRKSPQVHIHKVHEECFNNFFHKDPTLVFDSDFRLYCIHTYFNT